MKTNYVNTVVFNQDCTQLTYLLKVTGPSFLVNKYNFIGGKVNEGETNVEAAAREVQEEAFIKINAHHLLSISFESGEDWSLETFAIQVDNENFMQAKKNGVESIFISNIEDVFLDSTNNPEKFSNDFIYFLEMALSKFNF